MKKKLLLVGSILFCVLLLVGCGGQTSEGAGSETSGDKGTKEEASSKELGDYSIYLGGNVIEDGDKFIIEGESNLIPGSRVVGEVWVSEEEVFADTTELVDEDGSFLMELDHHKYGEAEIVVRFDFDGMQEDEVKRHYGEKGQKLEGPFIYKHKTFNGVLKKAEARVHYEPNSDAELVIQVPEWYELPQDYGDPRVWIEVEEITEDGEFFYIHGRSNLLEGSKMKVSYGWNNDTTEVNPDGSFDFKVDYEYLEDKEFVFEFNPANFQWNEIEEAYGKKGQKLVGNLVVTNKYNNNQSIELRVPWGDNGIEEQ